MKTPVLVRYRFIKFPKKATQEYKTLKVKHIRFSHIGRVQCHLTY